MAAMAEWDSISMAKKQPFSNSKLTRHHSTTEDKIDDYFKPLLTRVLEEKYFGINLEPIKLKKFTSSCEDGKGDRFAMSIPYANQRLEWLVLFNSECPDDSPDFEFGDKSFLSSLSYEIIEQSVQSLTNWNHLENDCLLRVITELVMLYKSHQISQLSLTQDRLALEYEMLISNTEICPEDVELLLLPDRVRPEEAHFLLHIALDFSRLPGRHAVQSPDAATLLVTFMGPRWGHIKPQLLFSKSLEETLGIPKSQHLPTFSQDTHLMDYVGDIKEYITEKINESIINFERKQKFIHVAACLQPDVVEFDVEDFSTISFLLSEGLFHFLVRFDLSTAFPSDPPKITLHSIYHMSTSKPEPYQYVLEKYPYSPRWEPEKMFKHVLHHIVSETIPIFKNKCMQKRWGL